MSIPTGEFIAYGPFRIRKTTLLNLMGGLIS
jgi:hypothetical protein